MTTTCAQQADAGPGRDGSAVRVELAFGEVRHQRRRPVQHGLRYRAFYCRVPVHALDRLPRATPLFGVNRAAPLSFHESDHGDGRTPLAAWIGALLGEHGIVADGEIWLHTFPRVFGYAFKPVSFWFCHDADAALRAIVAEVNNTFGERHLYLLHADSGRALRQGELLHSRKEFHVSPFCAVAGDYRFRFMTGNDRSIARVDHVDDEGLLITTSLSGRHAPIGWRSAARALLAYPLFSLGVIVRIHWHALRLWLRRVPFHRKPAPPSTLVTRGTE